MQQAVLHIHQAGKAHLGQNLLTFGGVLHQAEEKAVGVDDLATMHLGHPVVETLLQRAGLLDWLLILPVDDGSGRGRNFAEVAAMAGVVARSFVDLLVPDVEAGRDVPDGLRHRQHREVLGQHPVQVNGSPSGQQTVVIVDEVGVAVVDPLMIGNVGIGGVDADPLGDDFGQWPSGANQIIVDVAGAFLVAHQAAVLQLVVEAAYLPAAWL